MGDHVQETGDPQQPARRPHGYEPPRVEQVLASADLEREVLYAGSVSVDNPI
jgi:hypothetical protein